MLPEVVIIGAGGHGRVVADAVLAEGRLRLMGFLDSRRPAGTPVLGEVTVLGTEQLLLELGSRGVKAALVGVGSIGNASARARLLRRILAAGLTAPVVVHPRACVSRFARLGDGTVVLPGAIVTAGVSAGRNCILNTGSVTEHDCLLEDHVHLAPGAVLGGNCRIGVGSHVGLGARVVQGITVGRNVLIGAGAVVVRPVPDDVVMVGCPARVLRRQDEVELQDARA